MVLKNGRGSSQERRPDRSDTGTRQRPNGDLAGVVMASSEKSSRVARKTTGSFNLRRTVASGFSRGTYFDRWTPLPHSLDCKWQRLRGSARFRVHGSQGAGFNARQRVHCFGQTPTGLRQVQHPKPLRRHVACQVLQQSQRTEESDWPRRYMGVSPQLENRSRLVQVSRHAASREVHPVQEGARVITSPCCVEFFVRIVEVCIF